MKSRIEEMIRQAAAFQRRQAGAAPAQASLSHKVQGAAGKKTGELIIYGEIDEYWGIGPNQVKEALVAMGDVSRIDLHLNSPGGIVFDGVTIYNLLKNHPADVHVYVDGLAASSASFVAMAGDRIVMGEGSFMMIHNAWLLAIGNAKDMREAADFLDKIDGEIAAIYARHSGKELEQIKAWMEAETWFTGQEAVEAGLANEVQTGGDGQALARAAVDLSAFNHCRNLPGALKALLDNAASQELPTGNVTAAEFAALKAQVDSLATAMSNANANIQTLRRRVAHE